MHIQQTFSWVIFDAKVSHNFLNSKDLGLMHDGGSVMQVMQFMQHSIGGPMTSNASGLWVSIFALINSETL